MSWSPGTSGSQINVMFSITSSAPLSDPSTYTYTRHHPDAEDDAFMDVDLDDDVDDDGDKTAKLTSPGEPLTSAHAFMRFVFQNSATSAFHLLNLLMSSIVDMELI